MTTCYAIQFCPYCRQCIRARIYQAHLIDCARLAIIMDQYLGVGRSH